MKLVLIHGRSQQKKDSAALKDSWLESLRRGFAGDGLSLPIGDDDIRFPYYGDALYDLSSGASETAEVIVRGPGEPEANDFVREVLGELVGRALERANERGELGDEAMRTLEHEEVIERGILNWAWVQKGLELIDEHIPGASGASIALATRDVHDYLKNPGIQHIVESGIRKALPPGEEAVVVAHSLGTVVAYNLLRREAETQGWKVPLFVTLGSPLAVTAIKRSLRPLQYPAAAAAWFNAMDPADVVALYPLRDPWFSVPAPGIENHVDVDNPTENRHGITGYLEDPEVARRIHEALA